MVNMYHYEKEVDVTYFRNRVKTSIEAVNVDDIIYIKVKSPLNYGVREWEYYGRLMKKTNNYFDILQYCDAYSNDNWNTEQIEKKDKKPESYTKRWAKKSIIEIFTVTTERKMEVKKYYTNVKP